MILKFGVECWDAWVPGTRTVEQWQERVSGSAVESTEVESGKSSFECQHLPPKHRRRLSVLSKSALDVALGAMVDDVLVPVVFASRRGEVGRMVSLLQDICGEDEASPTAFSLSVHNTATGLLSINSGNTLPSTAIAAGHDTVASALIEACTQLACGTDKVLMVIAEDQLPEVYSPFKSVSQGPVAAAFLLTAGDEFQFQNAPVNKKIPQQNYDPYLPGERYTSTARQVEQLIRTLLTKVTTAIEGERLLCTLQTT